jgi:hypothetical protein
VIALVPGLGFETDSLTREPGTVFFTFDLNPLRLSRRRSIPRRRAIAVDQRSRARVTKESTSTRRIPASPSKGMP